MQREEAEILVARYFSGELNAAEKAALDAELAQDRELAALFADQEAAHKQLETLKLRWALPADFAARVCVNLPPLEKEKLVARYFDGDLSAAEQEQLKRELAQDRDLAALFNDQELAHRNLETLKLRWSLPADFTPTVLSRLPEEAEAPAAPLYSIHWRQVAMAASVAIVAGLIFTMAYISQPVAMPPIVPGWDKDIPPAAPRATVSAYSSGDVRVASAGSTVVEKNFRGDVTLPAEISAPADAHAVVKVGNGTAVLPKGAKARLSRSEGRVAIEPLDGDLYLESDADGVLDATVSEVSVSVNKGGVTLRKRDGAYLAEPSHGQATLRNRHTSASVSARELQYGVIREGGFEVQKGEALVLEDWAAAGRADELKRHLATLMKLKLDDPIFEKWDEVIRAMAAQPAERARQAAFMRFMVEENLLEKCTPEQQAAFAAIAEILAVGTGDQDIDQRTQDAIKMMREMLKDEQTRQWVKAIIKDWFENCNQIARGESRPWRREGRHGHGRRDLPPKND